MLNLKIHSAMAYSKQKADTVAFKDLLLNTPNPAK